MIHKVHTIMTSESYDEVYKAHDALEDNSDDRVTVSPKHLDNAKCHIGSENKTSTESSYECLIETDTVIEKTRAQRTLSSMEEVLQQGSDDPRRGGRC